MPRYRIDYSIEIEAENLLGADEALTAIWGRVIAVLVRLVTRWYTAEAKISLLE